MRRRVVVGINLSNSIRAGWRDKCWSPVRVSPHHFQVRGEKNKNREEEDLGAGGWGAGVVAGGI